MKHLTQSEAERKRLQAVEFLRRIGQDEEAERFEDMDADEYAEHKGAELENPTRRIQRMSRKKTPAQLQAELESANEYIEELESRLDSIAGIASGDEDEEDDDSEDGEQD